MFSRSLISNVRHQRRIFKSNDNFKRLLQRRNLSASLVNENLVVIEQDDGKSIKFPGIWLRDNCQCPNCFHSQTKSRQINFDDSNLGVRVKSIKATSENSISIDWTDEHSSTYDLAWLKERDFSDENRRRYIEEVYRPSPELWSKDQFDQAMQYFDYNDVLTKDDALLSYMEAVAIKGIALLRNVPSDTTAVQQLADRVGFIKKTTYGDYFSVKSDPKTRNYAYLMRPLPLHTDIPYFEYMPGINMLHYYVQSDGEGAGANLLADGFYAANKLRENYPEYFEVLRKIPVNWSDEGTEKGLTFNNIWREPVICLDVDGRFQRINHNTTKRDSHFTAPLEMVDIWYRARDKFQELVKAEAKAFKIDAGHILTFNNLRVLHGRTAFMDSPGNERHLIGGYMDWDIMYSKLRVLRAQKKLRN